MRNSFEQVCRAFVFNLGLAVCAYGSTLRKSAHCDETVPETAGVTTPSANRQVTATPHENSPGSVESWAGSVLFLQPSLPGIFGDRTQYFYWSGVTHTRAKNDLFNLALWQRNPLTLDGMTVPVKWDASTKTGLRVADPLTQQTGFNKDGAVTSTAQISGGAVGAYLNSSDLAGASNSTGEFLIAPNAHFAPQPSSGWGGQEPIFQDSHSGLGVYMQLQIPTAVDEGVNGCQTYAVMDTLFVQNENHNNLISINVRLFRDHVLTNPGDPTDETFYDPLSKTFNFVTSLGTQTSEFLTITKGSQVEQVTPWRGYKQFSYVIASAGFGHALVILAAENPLLGLSVKPSDFKLIEFHLNAELQYFRCKTDVPVELGWSMRNQKLIWLRNLTADGKRLGSK